MLEPAALGAGLGAVIGNNTGDGNAGQGALIGAALGAGLGGGIGNYMDRQEAAIRAELDDSGGFATGVNASSKPCLSLGIVKEFSSCCLTKE